MKFIQSIHRHTSNQIATTLWMNKNNSFVKINKCYEIPSICCLGSDFGFTTNANRLQSRPKKNVLHLILDYLESRYIFIILRLLFKPKRSHIKSNHWFLFEHANDKENQYQTGFCRCIFFRFRSTLNIQNGHTFTGKKLLNLSWIVFFSKAKYQTSYRHDVGDENKVNLTHIIYPMWCASMILLF